MHKLVEDLTRTEVMNAQLYDALTTRAVDRRDATRNVRSREMVLGAEKRGSLALYQDDACEAQRLTSQDVQLGSEST
jgi:hypothetical protein